MFASNTLHVRPIEMRHLSLPTSSFEAWTLMNYRTLPFVDLASACSMLFDTPVACSGTHSRPPQVLGPRLWGAAQHWWCRLCFCASWRFHGLPHDGAAQSRTRPRGPRSVILPSLPWPGPALKQWPWAVQVVRPDGDVLRHIWI